MARHPVVTLVLVGGLALLATSLSGAPSMAASNNCAGGSDGLGLHFSFGVHFGEPFSEAEQMQFAEMQLRARGYDVIRAEKWGSCIRAFVRNGNGYGTHMEFFDPETLEPVGDSPGGTLDLRFGN